MRDASGTIDRGLLLTLAWCLVFVAGLAALPTPPPAAEEPPAGTFAIVDATVFDGERWLANRDVWVEDGRVRAVDRRLDLPAALPRLDAGGRVLLPGLVDAHVHAFGSVLEDAPRFGVTTVLDQFSAPAALPAARERRRAIDDDARADLYSAGMLATAPGGHGTQFGAPVTPLTGAEQAEAWVRARRDEGSDWIKIVLEDGSHYGRPLAALDDDTLRALVAAAHEVGLLAVAHATRLADARRAIDAGVDGLVHVWVDELVSPQEAAAFAEAGVFVVPTLAVISSAAGSSATPPLAEAGADHRLSPMQRETLAASWPGTRPEDLDRAIENVRRLHGAGVVLLAGTDAPNPGTASGLSMQAELALLERAGLAPLDALRSATVLPARSFGIEDRGAIAPGQLADLVLLELSGDGAPELPDRLPIAVVWKDGRPVRLPAPSDRPAAAPVAAPDETLVADFETGVEARFGTGWTVSTDALRGGESVAELVAVDGALRVRGEVRPGFAFPWAGAMWFPGDRPMAPVDFASREVLRFRVRGDGRRYAVMVFGESAGVGPPPSAAFEAGEAWQTLRFELDRFGRDRVITGIAVVAQDPVGPFSFELDDVVIE